MARHRSKQLRYGLTSGVLSFAAGWAAIAILLPSSALADYPRWQSTIWAYLGAHLVRVSDVYFGGVGLQTVQPLKLVELPEFVYIIPLTAAGAAGFYTCYAMNSSRLKHNVSNAMSAGMGYFSAGLVAMVIADVRPSISLIIIIALVVGGAIWLGSTALGFLTGGIPFFGIASFGGIATVGLLIIVGGMAILSAILGLVMVGFLAPTVAGGLVGVSRHLERRGRKFASQFSRTHGLRSFLAEYWKVILATAIVTVALYIGLTGPPR